MLLPFFERQCKDIQGFLGKVTEKVRDCWMLSGLYATKKRWRIDPWLYGDIRNLHLRFLVHTFFHTVSYAIHLILYLVSLQNDAFFLKRPNKKRENWLIDIHKSLYHIKQIPQPAVCRMGDFCKYKLYIIYKDIILRS